MACELCHKRNKAPFKLDLTARLPWLGSYSYQISSARYEQQWVPKFSLKVACSKPDEVIDFF
jgi:hypothetical protein